MMELKLEFVRTKEEMTIGPEYMVKDSVTFREELMNALKSSSDTVTLQVLGSCPALQSVIAEDSDIKATLTDGDYTLFTGYLSTNWNWSVTHTGAEAVNFTIEDTGTRLLTREFIETGAHLFDCTVHDAVKAICNKAGIIISPACLMIPQRIVKTVKGGETCKDLLSRLLYEAGYVYHFDAFGRLLVHALDTDAPDDIPMMNGDLLLDSVSVKKSVREYRQARVSYKTTATAQEVLIYRNTTGQDDAHPFCSMALSGSSIFDGAEIWANSEEGDRTYPHIEACNADGNPEVASGEIFAVKDIRTEFVSDSSEVTCTVEATGGPYLKIRVENKGKVFHNVSRLDVYGTVLFFRSTEVIRTAGNAVEGEGGSVISEDLTWVHEKAAAKKLANLLAQYYRYSSARYTFSSTLSVAPGNAVRLTDDIHTGLDVKVLITKRTFTDSGKAFTYEAVGITGFHLDEDVIEERIQDTLHPIRGPSGKDGEDAIQVVIISSNGMIFRSNDTSFVTTLEARVFQGGKDVTSLITGDHFRWKRASGDEEADRKWNNLHYALTGNTIDLTLSDIRGRCSFFAEFIE